MATSESVIRTSDEFYEHMNSRNELFYMLNNEIRRINTDSIPDSVHSDKTKLLHKQIVDQMITLFLLNRYWQYALETGTFHSRSNVYFKSELFGIYLKALVMTVKCDIHDEYIIDMSVTVTNILDNVIKTKTKDSKRIKIESLIGDDGTVITVNCTELIDIIGWINKRAS